MTLQIPNTEQQTLIATLSAMRQVAVQCRDFQDNQIEQIDAQLSKIREEEIMADKRIAGVFKRHNIRIGKPKKEIKLLSEVV
jgi:hypothetical protein